MADISSITSAGSIQADYMKLLVTQLQNQNPLEPLDNNQMASQLAQLSQLSQIEQLNMKFSGVLSAVERNYASSLVGKEITFLAEDLDGSVSLTSGQVEEVMVSGDDIRLKAGDYAIGLSDIVSVKNQVSD
jgi:flagellar basal-body rod modification protein FlgD